MNCPNCGAPNRETSKFCYRCGIALPGAGAPAGSSPGAAPPIPAQQSRPAPAVPPPVSAQQSRPAVTPPVQAQPALGKPARHATQTITFDRLKHKNLIIAILAVGIFIVVLAGVVVAWLILQPGKSDFEKAQALKPSGEGAFLVVGDRLKAMEKIGSATQKINFEFLKTNNPIFIIKLEDLKNQNLLLSQFGGTEGEVNWKTKTVNGGNTLIAQPEKPLDPGLYCINHFDAQNNWRAYWCFAIK
jgi:hypothetical protein